MRTLLALVAVALAAAPAASARNPRLEQLALVPADMQLARSAILRADDLGSGWKQRATTLDDNAPPDCAWENYSRFTITGQSQTQFVRQSASVLSRVEVYRSAKQALGDFGVDSDPRTAACEGRALRKAFAKQSRTRVTLTSARQLKGPAVGDRSIAFRIALKLHRGAQTLPVYVDLIAFVRSRVVASVVVVAPGLPPKGNTVLAQRIDARLGRVA